MERGRAGSGGAGVAGADVAAGEMRGTTGLQKTATFIFRIGDSAPGPISFGANQVRVASPRDQLGRSVFWEASYCSSALKCSRRDAMHPWRSEPQFGQRVAENGTRWPQSGCEHT